MKDLSLCLLLLALLSPPGAFAKQNVPLPDPCQRTSVPLSFPLGINFRLGVVNHFLEFEPEVEGLLFLRNDTGRQIRGITMLVNYEDEQGHQLFTISYQANVKNNGSTQTNIRPFYEGRFTRPVEPDEVFELSGTNLLTTTRIPAKAVVSLLDLDFPDTGVYTGSLIFRSDPILEEAPQEYFQLSASPDKMPEDVLVKLRIGPRGTVKNVRFASENGPRDQILAAVMDDLRRWRFFPAIRDGFGIPSELFVLLRFRRADEPPVRECFVGQQEKYPSTFVIVTITPTPRARGRWRFLYGKYDVSSWKGAFLGRQLFESTPWASKAE